MKTLLKKTSILIIAFLALSIATEAQQLELDCESGNRAIEQGNCWGFGAVSYTRRDTHVINGFWSTLSNSMSNPALNSSWIKTPWMKMGAGNITLSVKLENTTGTTKQVVVSYIPYDESVVSIYKEGALETFYTFNFPKNGSLFLTTVSNLTIPIPQAIINSTNAYKILISFVGTGGNNRAIADKIIIPGEYWSDPANNCLPKSLVKDADNDGVADENDHFPNDITRAFNNYYPNDKVFGTLAFEDSWPGKGDYDFNDIVVNYNINRVTNASNEVVEVLAKFVLRASGASFNNAFGFQLDNISPDFIKSVTGTRIKGESNVFNFSANGLESEQTYANCIVFDDFFSVMKRPGGGIGVNVEKSAPKVNYDTISIALKMDKAMLLKDFSANKFNFYIVSNTVKDKRGREIHLADFAPTSLVDYSLFNTNDDRSNASKLLYYRTANNLPWGVNIIQGFDYPIEKTPINKAYNNFIKWAESTGELYTNWFENNSTNRNEELVY